MSQPQMVSPVQSQQGYMPPFVVLVLHEVLER